MYDYLIVGAGLFGSVFAYEAKKTKKSVLIIDKRDHIGGRLGNYRYYDMHQVIASALHLSKKEFGEK